jgi:serine/threonine protein kinase
MTCRHHTIATTREGHCAACLLEGALFADMIGSSFSIRADEHEQAGGSDLMIHVPLGSSSSASVFLARNERTGWLVRLKTWHTVAASDFLRRFQDLRSRVADLNEGAASPPLAASISTAGCPSVLSEFRQGTLLLDCVRQGRLAAAAAVASLEPLIAVTRKAHAAGLIHGSIVPGNVLFDPSSESSFLVDFGLTPLVRDEYPDGSADHAGFALLARRLRELSPHV